MQVRHRIPTIFSIYMVDVLCCALGCVILLWQLYHHESEEQTAAAAAALDKLQEANLALSSLTSEVESLKVSLDASKKKTVQVTLELEDTRSERDKAQQLALVRKKEYDETKKTLAAAEAMMAALRVDLKNLETKSTLTAAQLAEKIRAHADLFDKLAAAEKNIRALTDALGLREADVKTALKQVDEKANLLKSLEQELSLLTTRNKEITAKLGSASVRTALLEKDLDRTKKDLLEAKTRWQDLVGAQESLTKRYQISIKDLEKAQALLAALDSEKIALLRKMKDVQAAADNRFAGIQLTGRRVIFVVDMSGSMELVDDNTSDPDKWPLVCDTVARLMASLTDLQQYQVILFSDGVIYPFGSERRWLDYSNGETPKKVAAGLKTIKPKGGTNIYAALEEVFEFRGKGLDTIYFFSDGLPTSGEGLPAAAAKLTENQKTEILAKHVRNRLKSFWNRPVAGQRVRINTVGFFFESPDVGAFLWALARENDGSFVGMSKP